MECFSIHNAEKYRKLIGTTFFNTLENLIENYSWNIEENEISSIYDMYF